MYEMLTTGQVDVLIGLAVTLVGAVVGVLTAWSARISARQGALTATVQHHDMQLNGPTLARDARITALEVAGGQNMSTVPPAWNQLRDPLPDGSLPWLRTQECGEEVAAMIIMWRHGVPVSADALRSLLRGPSGGALTTGVDIASMLSLCNVEATPLALSWPDALKTTRNQTGAGRPVALMVAVPTGGYHWLCAYSSDDREVHYIDPWGGFRVARPWADLAARYAGSLVTVEGLPSS